MTMTPSMGKSPFRCWHSQNLTTFTGDNLLGKLLTSAENHGNYNVLLIYIKNDAPSMPESSHDAPYPGHRQATYVLQ